MRQDPENDMRNINLRRVKMNSLDHQKWQFQSKQLRKKALKNSEATISEYKDQRDL